IGVGLGHVVELHDRNSRLLMIHCGFWAMSSTSTMARRGQLIAGARAHRRRLKRMRSSGCGNRSRGSRQWLRKTVSWSRPQHAPTRAIVISSASEQVGTGHGRISTYIQVHKSSKSRISEDTSVDLGVEEIVPP